MRRLYNNLHGENLEIDVSEQEYAEALEFAIKQLDIQTEEEADERHEEINDCILDYFELYFEDKYEEIQQEREYEAQENAEFYNELKSWLNKQTGV